MTTATSYSIQELVAGSGFDRRTIVYYIQQGLLPKVGRRGPQTRYPAECLARLRFIKIIKGLQKRGELPTVTLADLALALKVLTPARLESLLAAGPRAEDVAPLFRAGPTQGTQATGPGAAPPVRTVYPAPGPAPGPGGTEAPPPPARPAADRRSYGLADASIRQRYPGQAPAGPTAAAPTTPPPVVPPAGAPESDGPAATGPEPGLEKLGELLRELELRPGLQQNRPRPGGAEQWTEIPISSRVYLSVRGLPPADGPLAETVARVLRRALRT